MAHEPTTLKRQRSRPSEWWAAPPLQPSPIAPPQQMRLRVDGQNKSARESKGIQEVREAGNRGVKKEAGRGEEKGRREGAVGESSVVPAISKTKSAGRAGKAGTDSVDKPARRGRSSIGEAVDKPVRRTRASIGEAGSTPVESSSKAVNQMALRRRISIAPGDEDDELLSGEVLDQSTPRNPGRTANTPAINNTRSSTTKKRGRPAATSSSRNEPTEDELGDGTEDLSHSTSVEEHTKVPAPRSSKKRGRPFGDSSTAMLPLKKKKRLSESEKLEQESSILSLASTPGRGRTRRRPSIVGEPDSSILLNNEEARTQKHQRHARPQDVAETTSSRPESEDRGRRRRPDVEPAEPSLAKRDSTNGGRTRFSRRSEIVEVEAATSKLTRGSVNRRPKASSSNATKSAKASTTDNTAHKSNKADRTISAPSQPRRKSSKLPVNVAAPPRRRKKVEDSEPVKRPRFSKVVEQMERNAPENAPPTYRHLAPVTRRVSRQVIETKWESLPPICVDRVAQLLQDIQRPIIARLHDERKKTQAGSILKMVSDRLVRKLTRGLPFPPGTNSHRENDFDFEKVLDHNRALEAQLTPTLHSNELLEAELKKEVARLETDQEALATLDENAKNEASSRSQAARKLHSILQSKPSALALEGQQNDIGLELSQRARPLNLEVHDDESVQVLAKDLDGHIDTIEGNMKQIHGISKSLAVSRAAVQAKLFDRLDSAQYDEVVFGLE